MFAYWSFPSTIASRSLPLELVEEILSRLPVKILLQLRCIRKSWKYLISDDPEFAKKHLRMSKILKQQQDLIVNVLYGGLISNGSFCEVIVSLDLKTESYQKIPQPDLKKDHWTLGMFRDCLCIFASSNDLDQNSGCYSRFLDVWIMKEYGIKESWTKLYHFSDLGNQYPYLNTVYISDDDQLLFNFGDDDWKWAVSNSKNGNVKILNIQHDNYWIPP